MVLKIDNISLTPKLFSKKGELIRIQFKNLSEYYLGLDKNKAIFNVNSWGNKISSFLWYKNFYSPKRLLNKYLKYSNEKIEEFENQLNSHGHGSINFNKPISSLTEPYRNLVYLKIAIELFDEPLLIGTAGMHIQNLEIAYELINEFLSKGGNCVELTYPSISDSDNYFNEILKDKIKIINA